MKNLLLILNPRAGQRKANRYLPDIIRLFCENDYQCVTYVTGATGDATRYLENYTGPLDLVVCIGGDGTLNETVAGVLKAGIQCPIGYIPSGTTNDYANSIGLSGDVMRAARDIMRGEPSSFDVGSFNGRHFVYTATCGAFAKASYTTSQAAKNVLGHLAYVLEGMRDLPSIRPLKLRVETDDRVLEEDFIFCAITNSTSIGGILKLDAQLVALNDGKFEVTLVKNPTTPTQLSRILQGITMQDMPNDMIYFFSTDKLSVTSKNFIEWTLDGERAPETDDVSLVNLHSAVQIVLSKSKAPLEIPETPEEDADENKLSN